MKLKRFSVSGLCLLVRKEEQKLQLATTQALASSYSSIFQNISGEIEGILNWSISPPKRLGIYRRETITKRKTGAPHREHGPLLWRILHCEHLVSSHIESDVSRDYRQFSHVCTYVYLVCMIYGRILNTSNTVWRAGTFWIDLFLFVFSWVRGPFGFNCNSNTAVVGTVYTVVQTIRTLGFTFYFWSEVYDVLQLWCVLCIVSVFFVFSGRKHRTSSSTR